MNPLHPSRSEYGQPDSDPVAIVGIGCRFPGKVETVDAFWQVLLNQVDTTREIPADRWVNGRLFSPNPASEPGTVGTRRGGFVEDIAEFDAGFFGISPREAALMDPQQRMLLEVAFNALENGGHTLESLSGQEVGVFIGIAAFDYAEIQHCVHDRDGIGGHTNTGTALSIAANRISYAFDLAGPSLAVDTACSSSLVAVHLACRSIANGECRLAIAGGVNAILKPEATIGFSAASMLATDGRCKTFDAEADGYARGEGAGLVVLKPLSDALEDDDLIYAVIKGAAVNQDGRTASMTVPSAAAQAAMLRRAYLTAGVEPAEVQFVEAHGTGTPVGDPIEVRALGTVLGNGCARNQPCYLGSVKTNIGHLEAAAGVAGLIKVALAIHHGRIPPNLNFRAANPEVPLECNRFRVPTQALPWPESGTGRHAGVNSFGFGGTNAHVVLGQPPRPRGGQGSRGASADVERPLGGAFLLPLSARSEAALQQLSRLFATALRHSEGRVELGAFCRAAARRRSHHRFRLAVLGADRDELAAGLTGQDGSTNGGGPVRSVAGEGTEQREGPVFVYSGMGPQWWAMGRELLECSALFRQCLEACEREFAKHADWSLIEELCRDEDRSRMSETQISQPANFALQAGLTALWRKWGLEPAAIVGHSTGEVAAAYASGMLDLENAVRVVFHRSRLQQLTSGKGRMAAVGAGVEEVTAAIRAYEARVCVSAVNSPDSVTLSGDSPALEELVAQLAEQGLFTRFLNVSIPYHSHFMEPIKDDLLASLADLATARPEVPLYSTVTGGPVEGFAYDADYWWRNVREPVQFAAAVEALIAAGHATFLEIGPHPVLGGLIRECLAKGGALGSVLGSLKRKESESKTLYASLAQLYLKGHRVDWRGVYPGANEHVALPEYPWQRMQFWRESSEAKALRLLDHDHPLLGARLDSPGPAWRSDLSAGSPRYLRDHQIKGAVLFPAAGYIELALAAGREHYDSASLRLEDVTFDTALLLRPDQRVSARVELSPESGRLAIHSRANGGDGWRRHVTGVVKRSTGGTGRAFRLDDLKSRCLTVVQDRGYGALWARGLEYGPAFQAIVALRQGQAEALGSIRLPAQAADGEDGDGAVRYLLHPVLLDACFQVMIGTIGEGTEGGQPAYLPIAAEEIRLHDLPEPRAEHQVYARLTETAGENLKGDVYLLDAEGNASVEVIGIRCKAWPAKSGARVDKSWLYRLSWEAQRGRAGDDGCLADAAAPSALSEAVRPGLADLADRLRRERYYAEIEPLLDRITAAYAWQAFASLGLLGPGRSLDLAAVAPQHHRLVARLQACLREQGLLEAPHHSGQRPTDPAAGPSASRLVEDCRRAFPEMTPELALIERCGSRLGDVLLGKADPVQVLFPAGSEALTEPVYATSPSFSPYNEIVERTLRALVSRLPAERPLQILEIGGGTGALASRLLQHLPRERTTYVFTDISPHFLKTAERKFARFDCLEYRVLDIEKAPVIQGFDPGQFDLVIAGDVLHATRDIEATLAHTVELLAPGSLLVLLELTRPPYWFDLTFGQLKGWWAFEDRAVRPDHACLGPASWRRLLQGAGLGDVVELTDRPDGGEPSLHSVFVASTPVKPERPPRQSPASGAWVLVMDRGGVGEAVRSRLASTGLLGVPVTFDGEATLPEGWRLVSALDPDSIQGLLGELAATCGGLLGVMHFGSLDAPEIETEDPAELARWVEVACLGVLNLVKALNAVDRAVTSRLVLLTQGSHQVDADDDLSGLSAAPLWGLGRTIASEYPDRHLSMIDLPPRTTAAQVADLVAQEVLSDSNEMEVAWRKNTRFLARLRQMGCQEIARLDARPRPLSDGGAFHLTTATPGRLDGLVLKCCDRPAPGEGEIEIEVRAAGLNFRDLMKAMGTYPTSGTEPFHLGDECAGLVSRLGPGVDKVAVGDPVVAVCRGFGAFARVSDAFVGHLPESLSFEQGATIPIVFLTAWHALHDLARIQQGERILIHAAAGGVGLAAIQIARNAGATVFATVGSAAKRAYLESFGVEHVMDSRSLRFHDEVLEKTAGQGVDIVLNSLAGDAITKSLGLLRPFGRFLEIGKADIYRNSALGLHPFRNNLAFAAVDMDQLFRHRPAAAAALLDRVLSQFRAGALRPLTLTSFPVDRAEQAFRHMAQAKHIGKIVLDMTPRGIRAVPRSPEPLPFRKDGTYLLTGGLGGVGLAVAQWMASNGAGRLVLCGRRGDAAPREESRLRAIEEAGAALECIALDVSQESAVKAALEAIRAQGPPLRGLVHMAMVLSDGLIEQQSRESLARVLAPKVQGALNLHRHSLDDELDLFVMFSSFAAVVGNPGQANYCAANLFLEALAAYRSARGLPGLTIDWGAFGEVGYVAEHDRVARHFERSGLTAFGTDDAMGILEAALIHRPTCLCAVDMDWSAWANFLPKQVHSGRFRHLVASSGTRAMGRGDGEAVRDRLMASPGAERPIVLEAWLKSQLARTLACEPEDIDTARPLGDIGVDSLIAVELSCLIEEALNVGANSIELAQEASITRLSERILGALEAAQGTGQSAERARSAPGGNMAGDIG